MKPGWKRLAYSRQCIRTYYHKMQCRLQCLGQRLSGISRNTGLGLCRILQVNFVEFYFYEVG
jgi:hypothetical protein